MKKNFIILGLLASGLSVYAQSAGYKGKVLLPGGQPAAHVTVEIEDSGYETETNTNGEFTLNEVPGKYTLIIHEENKMPQRITVEVKEGHHELKDIKLKKNNAELDEIVVDGRHSGYTANKASNSLRLQTPLLETPQNIQIVTSKVLADQQVVSMSDGVIRNASGLTKLEHWGDMYARINARGSRVAAFRNGMNITSNWGPLTEDMAFVDHIEFVKGPAGFMMSNGDPSGIYNVVTKRPGGETKGEASVMFGSYDFYRATADLDGKFDKAGKVQYRLNLVAQTKGSFRDYEFNDRYGIAPVISYQIGENTKVTAEYIYQHAKMSNVGSYYVFAKDGYAKAPRNFTLANPGVEPTVIDDHNVNFNLEHYFNADWKLTAQASLFSYQQTGSSMWTGADLLDSMGNVLVPAVSNDGKIIRNVSIWDASNVMKFGQVYLNGDITTGPVRHRILAGLDLADRKYMADWNANLNLDTYDQPFDINHPDYGVPSNGLPNTLFKEEREKPLVERAGIYGTITQSTTGIYLQDELGFFEDKLRLTLAGRYTYVKSNNYNTFTTGKRFTPRIGLSYSVDKETSVYGLYDQTFIPQAGFRKDGKDVLPVTGNNMELGIKRNWFDGKWNTTLSAYQILKNNQNSPDPSDPNRFVVQFGQTKTQGIEFDIRGEILPGMTLVANYAYTDSKISKAASDMQITVGNNVPGYAKHTANTWLNYTLQDGALKGLGISGGFTWMGERSTWTWTGASGLQALPDYFRLDGGLYYENGKVRITANMFNILDKYLYSGSAYANYYYWQAEAGRNWRLGVTYKF